MMEHKEEELIAKPKPTGREEICRNEMVEGVKEEGERKEQS
jgi:hypothetical protein